MTLADAVLVTAISDRVNKLTVKQLRQAGHDLVSAATEVSLRGHTKGHLINKTTGAVCCVGAIELVTYKRQSKVASDYALFTVDTRDQEANLYRAENATIVLADYVEHLCECNDGGDSAGQVAHYNDFHCPGGAVAYNVMRIAAARALVLADHKHELVKDFARELTA